MISFYGLRKLILFCEKPFSSLSGMYDPDNSDITRKVWSFYEVSFCKPRHLPSALADLGSCLGAIALDTILWLCLTTEDCSGKLSVFCIQQNTRGAGTFLSAAFLLLATAYLEGVLEGRSQRSLPGV
jgi:hypothetical protein